MTSQFPLGSVNNAHLQQLGEVLWSWEVCTECLAGKPCKSKDCPWPRSTHLTLYFQHYKLLTSLYECNIEEGQTSGLVSHEDIFKLIRQLQSNPELTKAELLRKLFPNFPIRDDQERALNLAARITMMVDCSASRQSSVLLEHGNHKIRWNNDVTFPQFLCDTFPQSVHPSIQDITQELRGTKLKKHARLCFKPTDDLRNHLRLDRKAAVVEIFHHTAFLKEQLRFTKDLKVESLSATDLAKLGVLPRALALEALDSIQKVLFPLAEPDSYKLLESLTSTSTSNFDTDVLRYVSSAIRKPEEDSMPYRYFGTRLADLHEELMNPTPRGVEKWFERNSGARFIMMATIAGVIFAIFLGMLSLGVAGFQAYVGYMSWKHPVIPLPTPQATAL
ncbi:uncharacterized protein LY89DRAFT_767316 [Mollisia scopiformis]|uniref:Uncharacterized protein n=1 Tax=Mollisia scopiformis TaxID=149040 RepID=A0A132B5Q4_MOLSC|nr:uncharacterized protein LY89DRAFT_767316 [Mollisia scopiformis]KUJ06997.1 hypothetical protein LY89DRAFT_767316 [Mollisia scopiformis]